MGAEGGTIDDQAAAWFTDHYESAASEILEFLGGDGLTLEGADVADVGCGDGLIDLGLYHKARPRSLVGFDLRPTDADRLVEAARDGGVDHELPPGLEFRQCTPLELPAPDASFDYVVTWSTFEHVDDARATAAEIRRVLKPEGTLFLQLYPFFHSEHGSHLWTWFPEGFAQLRSPLEELEHRVLENPGSADAPWTRDRLDDLRSLNRITIDELEDALDAAGLRIAKVELLTGPVHLPLDIEGHRLTDLTITGIKLLAFPR